MRIRYDAGADELFLVLREDPTVDAVEEPASSLFSHSSRGGRQQL